MTVLLTILTLAVVLLALLVGGLLRSHAEILRSLHDLGAGVERPGSADAGLAPLQRTATEGDAFDVVGMSPSGDSVAIGVVGAPQHTLLAFLSTSCLTCTGFWDALGHPDVPVPGGARLVIVTRGPEQESETALQQVAPRQVPTVMSTTAWQQYGVPVAPYFIFVEASGRVAGEGAASTWDQVSKLLGRALDDEASAATRLRRQSEPGEGRADAELAAAGIGPGHPSLRPVTVEAQPGSDEE